MLIYIFSKPVKRLSDYTSEEGVRTDVIIFNREHSSEFDLEREIMKGSGLSDLQVFG